MGVGCVRAPSDDYKNDAPSDVRRVPPYPSVRTLYNLIFWLDGKRPLRRHTLACIEAARVVGRRYRCCSRGSAGTKALRVADLQTIPSAIAFQFISDTIEGWKI
jgi:hypothetical protein